MKKTKLLTSLAALALVLSLGACETENVEKTSSDETTTSEDTSDETTTTEDGGDDESGDGETGGDENEGKTWQDAAAAKDILTTASAISFLSWTSFHLEEYEETSAETTYLTATETDEDDVYAATGVIANFALTEVEGQETRTLTKSNVYSNGRKYTYTPGEETAYATQADTTDPIDILDEYNEAYEDAGEYITSLDSGELDYYLTKTQDDLTELVVTVATYNNSHESNPELPEYFYTECVYVVDTNGDIAGLGYRQEDFMGGIEMCYYLEEVSATAVASKIADVDFTKYPVLTNGSHYEAIQKILEPLKEKTTLSDAYSAVQLTLAYEDSAEKGDVYYVTKDTSGLLYGIHYLETDESNYSVDYYVNGVTYLETVTAGVKSYTTGETAPEYATLLASYSHALTAATEILSKIQADNLDVDSYEFYEGGIGYELEYTSDEGYFFVFEANISYTLRDFDVVIYADQGGYEYAYEVKILDANDVISATDTNFDGTNWGLLDTETAARYHVNGTTGELEIHQADESGTCTICGQTGLNVSGLDYVDIDNETCYVSNYTTEAGVHTLFVPTTHDGKAVTGIGVPGASNGTNAGAFYSNTNLEFIGLPEGLTTINPYSIRQATALQSIEIPSTVTSIGKYAFYGCTALAEINFAVGPSLIEIADECFHGDSALTTFDMPDTVTTVGTNILQDCTSLTSAHISDTVESITGYTFYGCSSLVKANVPASLSEIPTYYFRGCTSLTLDDIEITSTITEIAAGAFYGCSAITNVDSLLTNVVSIGNSAFYNTGLVSITIPDAVTSIGTALFQNSKSLEYAALGAGITTIPNNTFNSCSALTTVAFAGELTSIASNAFNSVTLTTVYFAGTAEQWEALSNTPSATNIYYSGEWTYGADGLATPTNA